MICVIGKVVLSLMLIPCGSSVCNVGIKNVSLFCRPVMFAVSNWSIGVIFVWLMLCPGRLKCLATVSPLSLLMLNLCALNCLRGVRDVSSTYCLLHRLHVSFYLFLFINFVNLNVKIMPRLHKYRNLF